MNGNAARVIPPAPSRDAATLRINGRSISVKLRRAYMKPDVIGIRLTEKTPGKASQLRQYDVKGSLKNGPRIRAARTVTEAFNYLSSPATFPFGLTLLTELAKADMVDVCFIPSTDAGC